LAGHAGFFDVSQEELAQGGRRQAALDVGVIEVGAGEMAELLGDVFILAAGEGWSWRAAEILLTVLDQEVESFDGVGKGKRGLLFEVFSRHVEQIRYIGIAESGT